MNMENEKRKKEAEKNFRKYVENKSFRKMERSETNSANAVQLWNLTSISV